MVLVLMGPPGAGKGTQGERIVEQFALPRISTGAMFRDLAAAGTELGLAAKTYWSNGQLVPDDIVVGLVRERILAPDCAKGFVLDGFPRTVMQAEILDDMLIRLDRAVNAVVDLDVPDEELIGRLSGRRMCGNCGATYHVKSMPPQRADACDYCHGPLVSRPDDAPSSQAKRLQEYAQKTRPLLAYYARKGLLRRIDANAAPELVYERVRTALTLSVPS